MPIATMKAILRTSRYARESAQADQARQDSSAGDIQLSLSVVPAAVTVIVRA